MTRKIQLVDDSATVLMMERTIVINLVGSEQFAPPRGVPAGATGVRVCGRHLRVRRVAAGLEALVVGGPLVSRHRPSVDLLFESVAECVGPHCVAALPTGMGDDGALGMQKLKVPSPSLKTKSRASSTACRRPRSTSARWTRSRRSVSSVGRCSVTVEPGARGRVVRHGARVSKASCHGILK